MAKDDRDEMEIVDSILGNLGPEDDEDLMTLDDMVPPGGSKEDRRRSGIGEDLF